MSFKIYFYKYFPDYLLPTLTIELIGHFSIDSDSQYHADLSQLKYYIPPPNPNNVNYDLIKNSTCTRYKPDSYEKLNFIFQWIMKNSSRLEKSLSTTEERWLDIDFVCRRGVLKTLLCSPYKMKKRNQRWIICASKYRGTIYLCKFYVDEEQKQANCNSSNNSNARRTSGHKFEQYMVADHPSNKPKDPSVPLNLCEEFHCVFKAKFGNYSLLYGAETDGILSQQPIKDTLIGKEFELIELKTCPMPIDDTCKKLFHLPTASQWWGQSYLAGIKKNICGFKDASGIVKMIKEYSTDELPEHSRPYCDVRKCKMFCKIFLDNVKNIVTKDYNKCIYKFEWNPFEKTIVKYSEEAPDNETYFFLERWFVQKVEKYTHNNTYTNTYKNTYKNTHTFKNTRKNMYKNAYKNSYKNTYKNI